MAQRATEETTGEIITGQVATAMVKDVMTVGTGIVTAREAIIREAMTQARIIRDRQHLRAIMRAALATVKLITATAAMINFYI